METLIQFIGSSDLLSLFIKLFGIVFSLFYIVFSFTILRQIDTLEKAIEINDNGLIPLAGYIQLALSFILFIYSLLIL